MPKRMEAFQEHFKAERTTKGLVKICQLVVNLGHSQKMYRFFREMNDTFTSQGVNNIYLNQS